MQGLFPAFARFPVYLWVPARFFADFCIAWQIKKLEWSVTFFWSIFKQWNGLAKNRGVFSLRSRVFLFRGMQGNSAPPLGAPSLANGAPGSASHRGAPEAGPGTESAPSLTLTPHPPWRRTLLRLRRGVSALRKSIDLKLRAVVHSTFVPFTHLVRQCR